MICRVSPYAQNSREIAGILIVSQIEWRWAGHILIIPSKAGYLIINRINLNPIINKIATIFLPLCHVLSDGTGWSVGPVKGGNVWLWSIGESGPKAPKKLREFQLANSQHFTNVFKRVLAPFSHYLDPMVQSLVNSVRTHIWRQRNAILAFKIDFSPTSAKARLIRTTFAKQSVLTVLTQLQTPGYAILPCNTR